LRLLGLLTDNIEVKLVAFAMAIALWVYATNEHYKEHTVKIPVKIDVPEGVAVLKSSAQRVEVIFSGPERLISELRDNEAAGKVGVTFTVKPKEAEADEWKRTFVIEGTKSFTGVPSGLRVNRIRPRRIDVTLARLTEKDIPVRLNIVGDPPAGYTIAPGNVWVFPSVVKVRGVKTVLEKAEFIRTLPFDISKWPTLEQKEVYIERRIGIEQKVRIKKDSGYEEHPVSCDETVQFWIKLVEVPAEKVFEGIPVEVLSPFNYPYLVNLLEHTVDVVLTGPRAQLERLKPEDISAFVDVSGLRPSKLPHKCPISLLLPPEAQGKIRLKQEITVNVEIKEAKAAAAAPAKQ